MCRGISGDGCSWEWALTTCISNPAATCHQVQSLALPRGQPWVWGSMSAEQMQIDVPSFPGNWTYHACTFKALIFLLWEIALFFQAYVSRYNFQFLKTQFKILHRQNLCSREERKRKGTSCGLLTPMRPLKCCDFFLQSFVFHGKLTDLCYGGTGCIACVLSVCFSTLLSEALATCCAVT